MSDYLHARLAALPPSLADANQQADRLSAEVPQIVPLCEHWAFALGVACDSISLLAHDHDHSSLIAPVLRRLVDAFVSDPRIQADPPQRLRWLRLREQLRSHPADERRSGPLALPVATSSEVVGLSVMAFLSRVLHDLSAPVQGITAVLLSVSWPDAQQHQLVQQHIDSLTERIRQAGQYISASDGVWRCEEVALLPVCAAALSTVRLRAQQQAIQLQQDVRLLNPQVWGDQIAIQRILENLLRNAVGVTPAGGCVRLRVRVCAADRLEIAVIDQGPGMSAEQQARLFQPQARSGRVSVTGTGMGLGLLIVRELATALGGSYGVRSQEGCGSTFFVQLRLVTRADTPGSVLSEREIGGAQ